MEVYPGGDHSIIVAEVVGCEAGEGDPLLFFRGSLDEVPTRDGNPPGVGRLVPPFLAGLVAAVAVETSAGLLLYSDEGFLPALTLILTVEVGALGFGPLSGPLPLGGGVVEQVRRRWLF